MTKQLGPRIITLDIETAPIVAYVWSLFKVNVGLNQILTDWSILSVAWKRYGVDKVHYKDVSRKPDLRDDRDLLDVIWNVLDEADIIIAQNGIAFDVKKIQARFVQAGMPPPSPFKVVDTLLMAKQVAKFTSNKLEWMASILTNNPKDGHDEFPGMTLWTECLKGNKRAWRAMKTYNELDIPSCEDVYTRLRPYYQGHPNVAAYYDDDATRCPKCGSIDIHATDKPALTQAGKYIQYQCNGCGGFSRSRYTHNSTAKRKSLLAN
jgi:hypothetical protein